MTEAAESKWYSVRCVVRFLRVAAYEERITVWCAAGFSEAIALAEAEAREYVAGIGEARYCGLAQAYELQDTLSHGSEVFSLMRDSTLDVDDYLDRFFDTGRERQSSVTHASSERSKASDDVNRPGFPGGSGSL